MGGGVGVACLKQLPESLRIGDRGEVLRRGSPESVLQVARWVVGGLADGYSVAKDLTAVLQSAVRRLDYAPALDPTQHLEKHRRRDSTDRSATDPREHVVLEPRDDLLGVLGRPSAVLYLIPLAGDRLERARRRQALRFAFLGFPSLGVGNLGCLPPVAGVDAFGKQAASVVRLATGQRQRRVGIGPERQHLALAAEAVVKAPAVRSAVHG